MDQITGLDRQECQQGRGEREAVSREEVHKAYPIYPIGTKIRREFAGIRGRRKVFVGEVRRIV